MYFDETNNYFDIISEDEYKYNDTDFNVNVGTINFNREKNTYSSDEGFNKGNMFPNIYSKYKNHVYILKVNNPKDELLYKIQMYTFTLKDYNLYLDIYPNDTTILREFRDTSKQLEDLKKEYETKYGPLCITGVESTSKWTWLDNPWPWDKGGRY